MPAKWGGGVTLDSVDHPNLKQSALGVWDYRKQPFATNHEKLNGAISAASVAGGGVVLVPNPGTTANPSPYIDVDDQVTMRSNVHLLGIGRPVIRASATLKATTLGQKRLFAMPSFTTGSTWINWLQGTQTYYSQNVTIEGIVFDGNDWAQTIQAMVPLFSIDGLRLIDTEFRNYGGGGLVYIAGCRDVDIDGLRMRRWAMDYGPGTPGALGFGGNHLRTVQAGTCVRHASTDYRLTAAPGTFPSSLAFGYINVVSADTTQAVTRRVIAVAGDGSYVDVTNSAPWPTWTLTAANTWGTVEGIPTSKVRARGLDIAQGYWHGIQLSCRDFVIEDFVIRDVEEAGIYGAYYNHAGQDYTPEYHDCRDGLLSDFVIAGVKRAEIAACCLELAGRSVGVRNFLLRDAQQAGIQVNWSSDSITFENGHVYDTLKRDTITGATYAGGVITFTTNNTAAKPHNFVAGNKVTVEGNSVGGFNVVGATVLASPAPTYNTFAVTASDPGAAFGTGTTTVIWYAWVNYGQVTMIQRDYTQIAGILGLPTATPDADVQQNNITLRNVEIGHRLTTPQAKYSVRVDGTSVGSHYFYSTRFQNLITRYGWKTGFAPYSVSPTGAAYMAEPITAGADALRHYSQQQDIEVSLFTEKVGGRATFYGRTLRASDSAVMISKFDLRGSDATLSIGSSQGVQLTQIEQNNVPILYFSSTNHVYVASGKRLGINLNPLADPDPDTSLHLGVNVTTYPYTDGLQFGEASVVNLYMSGPQELRVGGGVANSLNLNWTGAMRGSADAAASGLLAVRADRAGSFDIGRQSAAGVAFRIVQLQTSGTQEALGRFEVGADGALRWTDGATLKHRMLRVDDTFMGLSGGLRLGADTAADAVLNLRDAGSQSALALAVNESFVYLRNDRLVVRHDDGTTERYKFLLLDRAWPLWVDNGTTEPNAEGPGGVPSVSTLLAVPANYLMPSPINSFAAGSAPAMVANTLYEAALDLKCNTVITGIGILVDAAAPGTDNVIVSLYDEAGNLLGQSASTAVPDPGAAALWQAVPLTGGPITVKGPQQVFVGVQSNAANVMIRRYSVATSSPFQVISATAAQGSFTPPATITPPTAGANAAGPICYLY